MKKITVLLFCIILVVSLTACGSDTSSDENAAEEVTTEESVSEDVEEETYDAEWPASHREMLRNPDDFTDKTVSCSGEVFTDSPYNENYNALFVKNIDDGTEFAIVLYKGDLNEKPLEGDHFSATGTFYKLYEQDGTSVPMIKADEIEIIPQN